MRHHLFLDIWITLDIFNTSGKIPVSTIWLIINVKGLMITDLMDFKIVFDISRGISLQRPLVLSAFSISLYV